MGNLGVLSTWSQYLFLSVQYTPYSYYVGKLIQAINEHILRIISSSHLLKYSHKKKIK